MTYHHRATPEQWETVDNAATDGPSGLISSCFLELRDRVEALEAAQRPQKDKPSRVDITSYNDPTPKSSLIEKVANAICHRGCFAPEESYGSEASAAILEIAAWLEEQTDTIANGGQWADMLRNEADR